MTFYVYCPARGCLIPYILNIYENSRQFQRKLGLFNGVILKQQEEKARINFI